MAHRVRRRSCASGPAAALDWPHRSTRKPAQRVTGWRCWLPWRRCRWLHRWRSRLEHHSYRIRYQGRWRSFRENGMLCWRLIDADLNCLRQETVLCKCHRLAFDRQCEGAGCLTHLTLHGAYIGAGWFRLELQGLRRGRRRSLLRPIEHQRRASCERIAYRGRGSGEDESNARHNRLGPRKAGSAGACATPCIGDAAPLLLVQVW
jgi:hypothetical protein